ncbi:MAG TPA: site-2 protease family protein [Actinotalea sp.]
MAYVVGLLVLLVGLLASIALHEIGHMVPAKRFGVRVSRYMVGFGPTLWSRTRGETEYGLKAFPLGGYVKLVGMFPPADVVGATPRPGRVAELVQAAREQSAEEILPGQDHRAFYRLSTPKKVVVMLGGPVMNLVIAAVLFAVILVGFGVPGASTTTVGVVGGCVLPWDAKADRTCTAADPQTPAAAAGLKPGDTLISFGGTSVSTWQDFTKAVQSSTGTVPLVVERAGRRVTLQVAPVTIERPVVDDKGSPVLGADGRPTTHLVRYVGLSPTQQREHQPLSSVPGILGQNLWATAGIVATLPSRLVDVAQATFGNGQRDASSVVGVVGVGRFAGEIASANLPGYDLSERVSDMLGLVASLNIALFVFNLIPLLPLDGGHVAGALWEGARRQVARLRGLPRPAPADVARMMPLAYGVFLVLAVMGAFLVYADIVKPVTLG